MNVRVLTFCAWSTLLFVIEAKVLCLFEDHYMNYIVCNTTDFNNVLQKDDFLKKADVFDIKIKRCQITTIDVDAFHNVRLVSILDLSENKIQTLKLGVFHINTQLMSINLSCNLLTELPVGIFDYTMIKKLYLEGNYLKTLEPGLINTLPKIFQLDLSKNFLVGKNLSPAILTDMKILNLSGNNMSEVGFLNTINGLQYLYMNYCLLKDVPTFLESQNMKTLKSLELSSNEISSIENIKTFNILVELEHLNMSHNYIEYIHTHVFIQLKKLQTLDLSYNRLKILYVGMFQNIGSLGELNLSHNLLQDIPPNSFAWSALKILNFANNKITYLKQNFFLKMAVGHVQLKSIEFGGNPWQCACLVEFFRELKLTEVTYDASTFDGRHLNCVTRKEFICKRYKTANDQFIRMYSDNNI